LELFGGGAGYGFGKIEKLSVLRATKIFAVKEFVQRNDLRTARGGFADFADRFREVLFGVGRAFHLHESNGKFVCHENQFSMSRKEKYLRPFCSIFCGAFVISIGIMNARFARATKLYS